MIRASHLKQITEVFKQIYQKDFVTPELLPSSHAGDPYQRYVAACKQALVNYEAMLPPIFREPEPPDTAFYVTHQIADLVPLEALAALAHPFYALSPYLKSGTWNTAEEPRYCRFFDLGMHSNQIREGIAIQDTKEAFVLQKIGETRADK